MKSVQVNSLGFDLVKSVPESIEEYDSLAKRQGACLDDAINSTLYRGTFAMFRDLFLHGQEADEANGITAFEGVESITGIERKTKEVKSGDKTTTVYDETEGNYWKRVIAEKFGGDADKAKAEFAAVAQEAMNRAEFDPSIAERKSSGPKTVAKQYVSIATDAVNAGKGQKLADMLAAHLGRAISLTGNNEDDIKILARAIADREAQKRAALKGEYAV